MPREISKLAAVKSSDFSRVLPDPGICRTKCIGFIASFATCLVVEADTCPYMLFTDNTQYCLHPKWKTFVKT